MKTLALLLAVSAAALSNPASAAPILTDLPDSTYITVGALNWTWVAPVSSFDWYNSNTLSDPSLHAGWRYATETEFAARPAATAFLRQDGSVIQSAIYWNTRFDNVNFSDGALGYLNRTLQTYNNPDDIWYVRTVTGAVPEPAAWALMIGGFGFVGAAMRRPRRTTVRATMA